ncbi:hypothetical protein HYALB_00013391 [Hymenoscyphus albidus]|uniref:Nephrocystin 3-like N-terminal domain-containing protein n=1 Tax=Hymenoscyphus albidus TaxID=595503 RepID=A0A9N9LWW0_9HELO|nr:hypothetical protein HYALB_00013391 [Hymenoscyphus albidus]
MTYNNRNCTIVSLETNFGNATIAAKRREEMYGREPQLSGRQSSGSNEYYGNHILGGQVHIGNANYTHTGVENHYYSGIEDPLSLLPNAADAPFNSVEHQNELLCLPNTRANLLQEIYDWANRQDERYIFWLNGLASTGKSTIARTIARRYFEKERLGASFFFSRGSGDVGHASKFFTSIAVQLANHIPSLRQYINNTISKRKDIAGQSFRDQ